ncbi:molybdopterin dinucleotide binding domain-containing protein [Methylocystis sp. IM2]|uniref:molybdopterin dinucleotide binding domain-containing protein n=1 Tax=Methylocystis sp. IM2 TaxID=3136563 RepID=UPI0030F91563
MRERVPAPYIALNLQDAARLHVGEGGLVAVSVEDAVFRLRVKVRPALPPGVAGAVMGLSGSIDARLPAWGKITPAYGISKGQPR